MIIKGIVHHFFGGGEYKSTSHWQVTGPSKEINWPVKPQHVVFPLGVLYRFKGAGRCIIFYLAIASYTKIERGVYLLLSNSQQERQVHVE